MRKTIYLLLAFLSFMASVVGAVWIIVSFIIYLVKDLPFDWLSIVFSCTTCAVGLLFLVLASLPTINHINAPEKDKMISGNSKWQKRMREIQEQRKSIKK